MRLHHVNVVTPAVRVGDMVDFYGRVLGLREIPKPAGTEDARGAWFAITDDAQVHVSVRDGDPHPDVHFALAVDDLDAVVDRLRSAGSPWSPATPIFGGARGFTRDPAGNRVEIFQS